MVRCKERFVRQVVIIAAVWAVLGVCGLGNIAQAAAASEIGIVDFSALLSSHPDTAAAQQVVDAEMEAAKKDYEAKAPTLATEKEKQAYLLELDKRVKEKSLKVLGFIRDKVMAAIKEVADAKGLTVIVDKSSAIYGGEDITIEVGKKFGGK